VQLVNFTWATDLLIALALCSINCVIGTGHGRRLMLKAATRRVTRDLCDVAHSCVSAIHKTQHVFVIVSNYSVHQQSYLHLAAQHQVRSGTKSAGGCCPSRTAFSHGSLTCWLCPGVCQYMLPAQHVVHTLSQLAHGDNSSLQAPS
jgi:hypothetical protein